LLASFEKIKAGNGMKTKLLARASALLAILCATPVLAGVIYRWQDVTPNPNTGPFEGLIEFSDDAWAPGGHLTAAISASPGNELEPIDGIEHFYWANPSGVGIGPHIELGMMPCSYFLLTPGCGVGGADTAFLPMTGGGGLGAIFDFTFGAVLEGGLLSVNESSTDVRMRSSGPLWTIERVGSDGPGICFFNDGRCWGSTGLWVLDLSTLPPKRVPEPFTVPLMLLAASALFVVTDAKRSRRRRGSVLGRRSDPSVATICSTCFALTINPRQ
jgi:hypothetical protein